MSAPHGLDWFSQLVEAATAIDLAAEALDGAVGCDAIEKAVNAHETAVDHLIDLVCDPEAAATKDRLLTFLSTTYSEA